MKAEKYFISLLLVLGMAFFALTGFEPTSSAVNPGSTETAFLTYYLQDFADTTFPPPGWSMEPVSGGYWSRQTASGYGVGTGSAMFLFFNAPGGTINSLVTYAFSPTSAGDSLKFDHAYATFSGEVDSLKIETSTNGGTTYTTLISLAGGNAGPLVTAPSTFNYFVPTAAQWASKKYSLPVGTNKIRFKAIAAFGNNLYIDNIQVGTPVTNDAGSISIDVPPVISTGNTVPKAMVKNFGALTQSFPVRMEITPGGYTNTQNVSSLAPGATIQVNFGNWNPPAGTYLIKVYTQLSGDPVPANDTVYKSVNVTAANWCYSFSNYPSPGANFGGAASYLRNDTGWIYVAGGLVGSAPIPDLKIYNYRTNNWVSGANMPAALSNNGMCIVRDSLYSVAGATSAPGVYVNSLYRYDIKANTWAALSQNYPGGNVCYVKCVSYQDSLIYCAGSVDVIGANASVYVFNTVSRTWRAATNLPATRYGGAFAISGDTLVYAGGSTTGSVVNTTYRGVISQTDRAVITWQTMQPIPFGTMWRNDAHGWLKGKIIFTGGSTNPAINNVSNLCYTYTPSSDTWTQMPNKPTAWACGQSASLVFPNGAAKLVCASGFNGTSNILTTEIFCDSLPSVLLGANNNNNNNSIPQKYALQQNYPNPFNPVTKITYDIPTSKNVLLSVFDVTGRHVTDLADCQQNAGSYSVIFSGENLSSGVYFYSLIIDGTIIDEKKMILIK